MRQISQPVAAELARAEAVIAQRRGDRFEQFAAVRAAMSSLVRVDAFYIAEFVGDNAVHYHHQYDGERFELPGSLPVRAGATAQWVRTHRRTYTYAEDDGRALHAGVPFGDREKASRDAVIAPIFTGSGTTSLLGLVSAQSYEPGTYDAFSVRALEYLAGALGEQIAHEERGARRARAMGMDVGTAEDDLLEEVITGLGRVHEDLAGLDLPAPRRRIEKLLSDLWARELYRDRLTAERLATLSPQCRRLAELIATLELPGGRVPTNAELATEMDVTAETVKSHMSVVRRAFPGLQRTELRDTVRRLSRHRSHQS